MAGRRHMRHLALAIEAGIAARHLSFIENGRSTPGRDTVLRLAEELDIPLHGRSIADVLEMTVLEALEFFARGKCSTGCRASKM